MEIQGNFGPILSQCPSVKQIIRTVGKVAPLDVNILLSGESGTGKNMLARALHKLSDRRNGPYVPVNCLAIPDTLLESELFGHSKGAFTDAYTAKKGCLELADKGTIYLDEIGDMTPSAQGKILQAIEEKHFRPLGSEKEITSDVRIITATNKDLKEKVAHGEFREDLYYRLKEVTIELPPLRNRKEDLPYLIRYYIECYAGMYSKPNLRISDSAVRFLTDYQWPGNFRELKHAVKSAVILCPGDLVWLEHFPFDIRLTAKYGDKISDDPSLETNVKKHVVEILKKNGWSKTKTAVALKISRPRLDRYIHKFNLSQAELRN